MHRCSALDALLFWRNPHTITLYEQTSGGQPSSSIFLKAMHASSIKSSRCSGEILRQQHCMSKHLEDSHPLPFF